jgi:hypothetical protein
MPGGGFEEACARVDYDYGRLDATFTANAAGQWINTCPYTAVGAVPKKRMRIIRSGTPVDLVKGVAYGVAGGGDFGVRAGVRANGVRTAIGRPAVANGGMDVLHRRAWKWLHFRAR